MSALTNRIFQLRRQGVSSPQEIATVVGLTPSEVAERLRDPALPDPTTGTGIVGGGGGSAGPLLSGTASPSPDDGELGDYYLDLNGANSRLHGPKTEEDGWGEGFSIIGGGGGSYARAVIALPGIGQNALNPGAVSGEIDLAFTAENLADWVKVDDIGLIADPPGIGTTHVGLPAGIYSAHASVLGISPSPSYYGEADTPTGTQDRTRFKVFQIALEIGSHSAMVSGLPSMVSNSVVLNGDMGGNFGGLTVGPLVADCRQDMVILDPGYEGLFGWLRLDKWMVARLDGTATINTTDEHTFVSPAITIEKLA